MNPPLSKTKSCAMLVGRRNLAYLFFYFLCGIPVGQMTKEERRDLRKMLKVELNKVQGLSSKLKARELQLRGQSQSAEMYTSLSDAEFQSMGVVAVVGDKGQESKEAKRSTKHSASLLAVEMKSLSFSLSVTHTHTELCNLGLLSLQLLLSLRKEAHTDSRAL